MGYGWLGYGRVTYVVCVLYGLRYWPLSTQIVTTPALLQVRVMGD
jgi:hypothetical protein